MSATLVAGFQKKGSDSSLHRKKTEERSLTLAASSAFV